MERNNLIKKGVVVTVILLFIGLAFTPSVNANLSKVNRIEVKSPRTMIFDEPIIEKPKLGMIYFPLGFQFYVGQLEFLSITAILSHIFTVKVSHPDSNNVSRIEFYLDNCIQKVDRHPPYRWMWISFKSFVHFLKVVAVSVTGETTSKEVTVIRQHIRY